MQPKNYARNRRTDGEILLPLLTATRNSFESGGLCADGRRNQEWVLGKSLRAAQIGDVKRSDSSTFYLLVVSAQLQIKYFLFLLQPFPTFFEFSFGFCEEQLRVTTAEKVWSFLRKTEQSCAAKISQTEKSDDVPKKKRGYEWAFSSNISNRHSSNFKA